MLKSLGFLVLLGTAFGLGYYVGQRPVSELRQTIADLSRSVLDTTLGLERNLRMHQGLVDAKSRVIQAKSDLLDRNFGNAARELSEAVEHLEKAAGAEREGRRASQIRPLVSKTREAQEELSKGKTVPRAVLDGIQKELDGLLAS